MLLSLLGLVCLPHLDSGGLGTVVRLPEPASLKVGKPERWSIRKLPPSPESEVDSKSPRKVRIAGRSVTIAPTPDWADLDGVIKGRDGSLLIQRASRFHVWTSQSFIWVKGKERAVPYGNVSIYRDRRNYAGSKVADLAPNGMPMSAPEAFVVESGRVRQLGFGYLKDWGADGSFVLSVPVDREGKPAGTDSAFRDVTRIVRGGRSFLYPDYEFVGRAPDGTLVLAGNQGDAASLLRLRAGKVADHWRLPRGWTVEGMSKRGWVLLDRPSGLGTPAESSRFWTAGILLDGKITPIRFPWPSRAKGTRWSEDDLLCGIDAFRFFGRAGREWNTFRVSAPASSVVRPRS